MTGEFKEKVLKTVDAILSRYESNMWFMAIKPVVNLAKPELEKMVDKEPEEVYKWLKIGKAAIDEAITTYENENNKM